MSARDFDTALGSLERDSALLDLITKLDRLDTQRAEQIQSLYAMLAETRDELAEVRDELATHETRHRRDVDALRESIRATDRVLADRTSHLA